MGWIAKAVGWLVGQLLELIKDSPTNTLDAKIVKAVRVRLPGGVK